MGRAGSSAGVYTGIAGDNGTIVSIRQLCWFTLAGDPAHRGMSKLWQIHFCGEIQTGTVWHEAFLPQVTARS